MSTPPSPGATEAGPAAGEDRFARRLGLALVGTGAAVLVATCAAVAALLTLSRPH